MEITLTGRQDKTCHPSFALLKQRNAGCWGQPAFRFYLSDIETGKRARDYRVFAGLETDIAKGPLNPT